MSTYMTLRGSRRTMCQRGRAARVVNIAAHVGIAVPVGIENHV
jgi:hypothetical protein